jgi:hypothetical protein
MPITAKLPPLFTRLLPYVALINEFEDMPAAYVPMARLVFLHSSSHVQNVEFTSSITPCP